MKPRDCIFCLDYVIIKVFAQKYLNRTKYGMGTGKAQEIEEFVK
jgi:GTP-binding protein HflX